MQYPTLSPVSQSYEFIERFGGYRHTENLDAGEFFNMENLTADHYPLLAPRAPRSVIGDVPKNTVLLAKDTLCYPEKTGINVGGYFVDLALLPYHSVSLLSMGAYIILLTKDENGNDLDKKWLSTADLSLFGNVDAIFESTTAVTFEICKQDGETYCAAIVSSVMPEDPRPLELWLDTSVTPAVLRRYSSLSQWEEEAGTCVRISCPNVGAAFSMGDGVMLYGPSGDKLGALTGNHVIRSLGRDHIVIDGILDGTYVMTEPIRVERRMPKMDHLTVAGNRLWGCRYGTANDGSIVNEIYCSRLGDFKNWSCFEGISTDSYVAGVGTDGPFTAAVTHLGMPLFFKENHLHKVYGSYPANFRILESALPGIQRGCERSAVTVGETLCYKARDGVYAYDGALPVLLSAPLGNTRYCRGAAGALGDKYYICMRDEKNVPHLFVYDLRAALWHREDSVDASCFAALDGKMYFVDQKRGKLYVMNEGTESVRWMAETGTVGAVDPARRTLTKLKLRLKLPLGSALSVFIRYDGTGGFQHLGTFYGSTSTAFELPILPRRCDHFTLRLTGKGDFRLFSLTKVMERRMDL